MAIHMNEAQVHTLHQVCEVLAGTQALQMRPVADDPGRYVWIETVLRRFDYRQVERADRGVNTSTCLQRMSAYSRAQVKWLVSRRVCGKRFLEQ